MSSQSPRRSRSHGESSGANARAPARAAVSDVPRLALDVSQSCEAIGVSWDFWRAYVEPEVRVVRRGRRKLIAVTELQRWLDNNGERVADA